MAEHVQQDHRLLKAVVIGLGVAILLGFGLLVWGLVTQGGAPSSGPPAPLVIPQGAQITQMALSDRVLALKVEGAGRDEIVLVDLRSGQVIRRVPVSHGEPRSP